MDGFFVLGYYDYTVIATYLSLVGSVIGIFLAAEGNSYAALLCLMCSGLLDSFDGKIARTKKNRSLSEKRFGIQIDSLCDLVGFGVLPAAICYSLGMRGAFFALLALYILCAQIRLAYFNVEEEERQSRTSEKRTAYSGMPVTSISVLLPAFYLLGLISDQVRFWGCAALLLLASVLFISPLRIPKLRGAGALLMGLVGAVEFVALIVFF